MTAVNQNNGMVRVNTQFKDELTISTHNAFESIFGDILDHIEATVPSCSNDELARSRRESARQAEMARRRIVANAFRR